MVSFGMKFCFWLIVLLSFGALSIHAQTNIQIGAEGEWILGNGTFSDAAFSPDGHYVATVSTLGFHLWDRETTDLVHFSEVVGGADFLKWSADASKIVVVRQEEETADYNATFLLFDMASFTITAAIQTNIHWGSVPTQEQWLKERVIPFNVAWTLDGKILSIVTAGNVLDHYDGDSGVLIDSWQAPEETMLTIGYCNNGEMLWIGMASGTILFKDAATNELDHSIQVSGLPYDVSSDGQYMVSRYGELGGYWITEKNAIHNAHMGKFLDFVAQWVETGGYREPSMPTAFSSDNQYIYSNERGNILRFKIRPANVNTGQSEGVGSQPVLNTGAYSRKTIYLQPFAPDFEEMLFSGYYDTDFYSYNLLDGTRRVIHQVHGPYGFFSFVTVDQQDLLYLYGGGGPEKWIPETKQIESIYQTLTNPIALTADASLAAQKLIWTATVEVQSTTSADFRLEIPVEGDGWTSFAAFSPDKSKLLLCREKAWLWDVQTGELYRTLDDHGGYIGDAAFSSDSSKLITTDADNTMREWDLETGESRLIIKTDQRNKVISYLPDETRIAILIEGKLHILDRQTGEVLSHIDSSVGGAIVLSPDGKYAYFEKEIWNLETCELVNTYGEDIGAISKLRISPDGRWLAARMRNNGVVRVWDTQTLLPPVTPVDSFMQY
jgi:WD40 repeat protein